MESGGEKVDDISKENEESGSIIHQDETNKENAKQETLVESVKEGRDLEDDSDAKQEKNTIVVESEKRGTTSAGQKCLVRPRARRRRRIKSGGYLLPLMIYKLAGFV